MIFKVQPLPNTVRPAPIAMGMITTDMDSNTRGLLKAPSNRSNGVRRQALHFQAR
jgi:hypothetical protein